MFLLRLLLFVLYLLRRLEQRIAPGGLITTRTVQSDYTPDPDWPIQGWEHHGITSETLWHSVSRDIAVDHLNCCFALDAATWKQP